MIQINNNLKYIAFNGSKKQFMAARNRAANYGRPDLGKLVSKSSIETWQFCDADKKAIRAGEKRPEDCTKTVYAACGRTRKIYLRTTPQIPVAADSLRKEVERNCENRTKHPMCKNWTPIFENKKPWTKVDALHGLAMYRLSKWDILNPKPDTDDESDILTHKKRRADAFSKIVTRILNDSKPKVTYRVLIYGKKNYSLDEYETYYFETFTKYETALRAFIDNTLRIKKQHKEYTRADLTGFGSKYSKGFKVFEYDQRGHMADILKPYKNKLDMTWYTRMNECKEIPIKQKTAALAA